MIFFDFTVCSDKIFDKFCTKKLAKYKMIEQFSSTGFAPVP